MKRHDVRVSRGDERYAYSAGEVVEALQGAGVLTDDAIRIARDMEKQLRSRDVRDVELNDLMVRLEQVVRERVSPEAAQRFRTQTPPFVSMKVTKESDSETFSRRTLSHSLEKYGLPFKEAYAIAKQVEQSLRAQGYLSIEEDMLAHIVALALESRYGREARLTYESSLNDPVDLYVLESDGSRLPYSRGILARALMSVGLGPELAYNLAKRIEDILWRSGERNVTRVRVRREVERLLVEEAGVDFARRYQLLHQLRQSERPVVVLIGGAPGVGKSTVASELGYRLGIPRMVSTDAVRQALRSLISAELSPLLHESSYTAWRAELLPPERIGAKPEPVRVIRGFRAQIQQLATAVTAIIERSLLENMSLVMEGIHLVPGLSPRREFEGALVVELMLIVEDEKSHRDHFGLRERQTNDRRDQDAYLDHFREIRMLQEYLLDRARAERVPVVDASDFDQAIDKAMEHILASLLVRGLADGGEDAPAAGGR
ncbi:MAG: ATP cone domain-containing protein [Trueperaceae bacterium]